MMETLDELRQEPHWSYSALNTYLNICQAQFMYRYVEHAEVERTSACFPVRARLSRCVDSSGVGVCDWRLVDP
ncbi:MAG: hypothetical protein L6W00_04020 [Lentisphaeria bacterium]|nr:MAG: hypothetical protein L6W00_04020 [Lentisphaeria bacterium]